MIFLLVKQMSANMTIFILVLFAIVFYAISKLYQNWWEIKEYMQEGFPELFLEIKETWCNQPKVGKVAVIILPVSILLIIIPNSFYQMGYVLQVVFWLLVIATISLRRDK